MVYDLMILGVQWLIYFILIPLSWTILRAGLSRASKFFHPPADLVQKRDKSYENVEALLKRQIKTEYQKLA